MLEWSSVTDDEHDEITSMSCSTFGRVDVTALSSIIVSKETKVVPTQKEQVANFLLKDQMMSSCRKELALSV